MIYHIAIRGEWDAQAELPTYVPDRYRKDGFIHCSELQQLERVADYNFRGRSDLLLLEIMPTRLQPETRYEQGGRENILTSTDPSTRMRSAGPSPWRAIKTLSYIMANRCLQT